MDKKTLREAIAKDVIVHFSPERPIVMVDEASYAPWLFDFRALLLQPRWLDAYAEFFWDACAKRYPFQVCAMESAGIALVAAIVMKSMERGTPVNGLFIRKSRKRQGLMRRLEGAPTRDPVILVDDLVNSGNTFTTQIQVLEREGLAVSDMFALIAFRDDTAYAPLLDKKRTMHKLFTLEDFGLSLTTPKAKRAALTQLWHFAAPNPAFNYVVQKSAPVLDAERVYFGSDAGTFYALNQNDGSVAWSFETGKHPAGKGIFSSPALHRDTVYFGAYDGNVYALEARSGTLKWKYEDADWVGSSPSLAPDLGLLFIGLEFGLFRKQGGMVALRMDTGEVVWQHHSGECTHGSPLYIREKNMVVVGSNDDIVYAYRADSGAPLWQYRVQGSVKSSFAYDPKRQLILFGSLGGLFYALDTDGTPIFAYEPSAGSYSTPLVIGETAYFSSLDKGVYALDLDTGSKKWEFRTAGRIFASPLLVEDAIYIGSNDGRLYAIDPETGAGQSVFQATERIVNKIAYNPATKRFFMTTVANELYCMTRTPQ
ncbi:MAG TPA: PQQ-binding-like beta-propeller repeat protein [Candidatus Paceibacterota bacterium]|nr:PQQ-binding-like beta-propeller repeat protein [Candidatus Paceibacterota bacterium]